MRIGFSKGTIKYFLEPCKSLWREKFLNFTTKGSIEYPFVIECSADDVLKILKFLPLDTDFVLAAQDCYKVLVSKEGKFRSPDFYSSLELRAGLFNNIGIESPEDGSVITEDDLDQIHQMYDKEDDVDD